MEIKYRIDLYKLLPQNPVTAEIGVAEGFFSRDICEKWKPSKHYLVDNWSPIGAKGDGSFPKEWHDKNHSDAIDRMKPFENISMFLIGPSYTMALMVPDLSLDIVYIDADHSYEGVKKDLESWFPKVKIGGVIAGHDYINPAYGVLQAVNEFSIIKGLTVNIIPENKEEDAGFWMYKPK